eukprot:748618-Hanusia_phi.AAC.1
MAASSDADAIDLTSPTLSTSRPIRGADLPGSQLANPAVTLRLLQQGRQLDDASHHAGGCGGLGSGGVEDVAGEVGDPEGEEDGDGSAVSSSGEGGEEGEEDRKILAGSGQPLLQRQPRPLPSHLCRLLQRGRRAEQRFHVLVLAMVS